MLLLKKRENDHQQLYLVLLARYAQLDKYNQIKLVELTDEHAQLLKIEVLPKYLTTTNEVLYSLPEISRSLLEEINCAGMMIGSSVEEQSNTNKFFELVHHYANRHEELVKIVDKELEGKMFLNDNTNIHISDLYVFCCLMDYMLEIDNQTKLGIPNVYRWFNYIQKMRGIRECLDAMGYQTMDDIKWGEEVDKKKKKDK